MQLINAHQNLLASVQVRSVYSVLLRPFCVGTYSESDNAPVQKRI